MGQRGYSLVISGRIFLVRHAYALLLAAIVWVLVALPACARTCNRLRELHLAHGTITGAEVISNGTFSPPSGKPLRDLPPFCRVTATLKPSEDSNILVEIWMPESGWNQRFEGTGNGGFAGKISWGALAEGLRRGYAVANTDMGMATPPDATAAIFTGRPERWIDWGYRSTHEMTVAGKVIVGAFYTQPVKRSYFVGCSTGGEQALMESQRYPDDYDGIAGGAPAQNRTGVHASILWNFAVNEKTPGAYLSPAATSLIAEAVMNACDSLDGVKDGIINDPTQCHFDPASLACKSANHESCLTAAQVKTAQELYAGPVDPRTGQSLYPGLPRGSEFAWQGLDPGPGGIPPYFPIFQWVFGVDYDWRQFDFDHDYQRYTEKLAPIVNATSADIDTFRQHGHKLLMYHGWSDWLVAPGESINYYEAVVNRGNASSAALPPVDDSLRLFMVPGMAHCAGGPGATHFDALGAVVDWVEKGTAPDSMMASKLSAEGETILQRPLCPYPRVARYRGMGTAENPASFVCSEPSK